MPKNFLYYFLVFLLLGLAIGLRISLLEPLQKLPKNQHVIFLATVQSEPRISGSRQVIKLADGRVYIDLFPRYRVGDRLRVGGEVDGEGNIFNGKVERLGRRENFWSFFADLRLLISKRIDQLLPSREAALVKGTVLGVDDLDRKFRDQLIRTGTIHVVVVSGQNLMIVAGVFLSLARYIGRRQSLILATLACLGYALLAGFEPPVVRASIMVLASSIAIYFGRETIPLWNLILAALIILFFWPGALMEISFQLTFAASLGIMTLGRWLSQISNVKLTSFSGEKKILNLLKDNAAIATSAYLFTLPIIFWYFGRVSLVAPIVNVLVAEVIGTIMVLGFLIAFSSLIFMPFAQLVAYFVFVPAFYFVGVVEFFSKLIG